MGDRWQRQTDKDRKTETERKKEAQREAEAQRDRECSGFHSIGGFSSSDLKIFPFKDPYTPNGTTLGTRVNM